VLEEAWTTENYRHEGRFRQMQLPVLRPQAYQKPYPPIIRACSGLKSTLDMASQGRPFLMNFQSDATTQQRIELYRQTMADAGYDKEAIEQNVADTDAEAETIGVPCFREMRAYLSDNRRRFNTVEEQAAQAGAVQGAARDSVDHSLIYGSPDTVCEKLEELRRIGVSGLIIHFRLGPMTWETTENSLRLFADQVAPEFRSPVAA
jgi:alkanesulfonate monooxygenase SsuD/methylene tetrahydromethanopterin reductase-like flavin-dependent oxidoreductase (luciferase family)